ncbi:E3 ubiquitin-protein ligase SIS3 [Acorus calamus]|uniref:RING-type E3 ubiquitin transferase n=1 Tax=Acorus calamus TaxID=4465 RepID=A0AAV9FMB5_ACOCL|nr:E3 ubiquitin-protein ligase SIS3 [Acorus calamus]
MGQRNYLCARQMIGLEFDQGQSQYHSGPCMVLGTVVDFQNPSIPPMVSGSGSAPNIEPHHFMDHHDGNLYYSNQHSALQHSHPVSNIDYGTPPSTFHNSGMAPSVSRIFSTPLSHGSSSSSNHGVVGVPIDEYGRNNHFYDNARGSCKRKNAEGVPVSHNYANVLASSSSTSNAYWPPGVPQWEPYAEPGFGRLDAMREYRGTGVLSITEGSQRSVRSRSSANNHQMDSALAHPHHNPLVQGNYTSQSFRPASNAWVDQIPTRSNEGGSSSWNSAPVLPYFTGRNVNGGMLEIGNLGGQVYPDAMPSRNSGVPMQPLPVAHHHRHLPPAPGLQNHNYNYLPQAAPPPSFGVLNCDSHHGIINPLRDNQGSGFRYPRAFPSGTNRIHRPSQRPQSSLEEANRHLRFLPSEDITFLEYSGYYGVGDIFDQHRDMRLDIDDMSYEELLALEERIGDVSTGLPEETILKHLKMSTYKAASSPSKKSADMAVEDYGNCIICQVGYEEDERIGALECGHEYHAECIKQWLLVKNLCPICKSSAFEVDKTK